ncbi:TonB-dependent receptor [Flavobacterium jejuense]|uniref:TonB-dependent receptor n=1 Tax=Flavobacterium jejuense TaxID=1544455 RepID=A0ABX0IU31_9FLAO|nr:VIT domain-containing protein [Flavobacterium jejuense]NHN25314.1 TonB-dependent receptor [Flavobacterium jejuense]
MKKVILFLLFVSQFVLGQNPQLTVKDKDSSLVRLSQLKVNVKVVGNIAYTTTEMHFFNASSRDMEAELLFPLPEGVSVSRYAIDINGKMREAVPVNKNKGKQVFEAIEHRRVDPGLLERVEGNSFKTRIYPILPNKERVVIIGYEQELTTYDTSFLGYQMVSAYTKKIDDFELEVTVVGSNEKPIITNDGKEITIEKFNTIYQAKIQQKNYLPNDKLLVKIPITSAIPTVIAQANDNQYYFYANMHLETEKKAKALPKSIGLLWDVSLSSAKRDTKKELDLLEAYFKKLGKVEVSLYFVGFTFDKKSDFIITNGDWSALRSVLEKVTYDGGTRFSEIIFPKKDEILFFTDGLSTLSDATLPETKQAVYTITSSVTADYAFLNYNAMQTGGTFVNLNQVKTEEALDRLLYKNLLFFGVKNNPTLVETYPMIGTSVTDNFSVSGISLLPTNEITLLFGYDANTLSEKKIQLDVKNQAIAEISVEKLWAQKKIANLEIQYEKNAEAIETMGKKYGIITPNTSLIVLEDINDYILYDIIPPAELREEFDKIKKNQLAEREATKKSNWNNIDSYFKGLSSWWKKDIKYVKPKFGKFRKNKGSNTTANTNLQPNPTGLSRNITVTVSDALGPLAGATVQVKNTTIGTSTNFDGNGSLSAKTGDVLVVSFVGLRAQEIRIESPSNYTITLENDGSDLQEVVVAAYASEDRGNRRERRRAQRTVSAPPVPQEIDVANDENVDRAYEYYDGEENDSKLRVGLNYEQALAGQVAGVAITTDSIFNTNANTLQNRNSVKKSSWNPDRVYLKALAKVTKEEKYPLYLQLREVNKNNPSFYFDVANHFYEKGDRANALLILSNIAELDLENHQLYKSLLYLLRQWEANEMALHVAKKIVTWRTHEPQSHRDLALTLEDNKLYQEAFDALLTALETNYYGEMSGVYQGIEDIILMDINRIVASHKNINTGKLEKKYLEHIPVDVRIILNWNQMDTDIDLHIIEPTGEECYYSHTSTDIGARFSKDFTQGYGPEQYLLRNAIKGKYKIKTNYYGETKLTESGPATVMVEIYIKRKNGKIERTLQTIQLGKVKENQNLAEIEIE